MDAYLNIGICLELNTDYKQAIFAFKRLLQVAWNANDHDREMKAYEMIGKIHFYLGNIKKASYYHDRSIQGK